MEKEKLKTVVWNIRVSEEYREKFHDKYLRVGFKSASEAFRFILQSAQTAEDIHKNMQCGRSGLEMINGNGKNISICVRVTKEEKEAFCALCKTNNYIPAKVARTLIENWCQK